MRTVRRIAPFVLLGLLAVGVRSPYGPSFQTLPDRDSGVFLYIGSEILDGKIPYRAAWDDKPPAIYYIDALGIYLGRGSIWGVWFLQLLAFVLAVWLGFAVLDGAFGRVPAIFGSITWVLGSVYVLGQGNLTEEYALPLQFLALYSFSASERQGSFVWRGVLIGIAFGLSFLLKPNLVGVDLAILMFLLWPGVPPNRIGPRWRDAGLICLTAVGVVLSVGLYFAVRGALTDFLDAAFRFNFVYMTSTPRMVLRSVFAGFGYTSSGLLIIALAAWFVRALGYGSVASATAKAVADVALIGLPIEFLLASLSGRYDAGYRHYFIAWLPMCTMLAGVFAYDVVAIHGGNYRRLWKWDVAASAVWVMGLMLAMSLMPLVEVYHRVTSTPEASRDERMSPRYEAIDIIRRITAEPDYVLIWGFEPSVNFVAHRKSPTRFVYQLPLYVNRYQSPRIIDEFLHDIQAKKPVLIIDASSSSNDVTPPIDPIRRRTWKPSKRIRVLPEMDRVFEYLTSNYRRLAVLGPEQQRWSIYQDRHRLTSSP